MSTNSAPLNRNDIVSATVEDVLRIWGCIPSPTGSGFEIVEVVMGAGGVVDVQVGFSPRGTWLASPYTDDNIDAVNELNTFTALMPERVGSRDLHPDSGMEMSHVSYQLAFRALVNSPDFRVLLTPDMLNGMGKTDAEVFTPNALRTGLTLTRVMEGLVSMPGQTLPVWTGEHCGATLSDSWFHERFVVRGLTRVLPKGTWWQAPWWENFSMVKAAASKIVVPTDGSLPYIDGPSTDFHEYLTRRANARGLKRVKVVIVYGDDSEYCDLATVLDLIALGYIVIVAYEGMAPLNTDAEAVAFRQMQEAGAIFVSVAVLREANEIYSGLQGTA